MGGGELADLDRADMWRRRRRRKSVCGGGRGWGSRSRQISEWSIFVAKS